MATLKSPHPPPSSLLPPKSHGPSPFPHVFTPQTPRPSLGSIRRGLPCGAPKPAPSSPGPPALARPRPCGPLFCPSPLAVRSPHLLSPPSSFVPSLSVGPFVLLRVLSRSWWAPPCSFSLSRPPSCCAPGFSSGWPPAAVPQPLFRFSVPWSPGLGPRPVSPQASSFASAPVPFRFLAPCAFPLVSLGGVVPTLLLPSPGPQPLFRGLRALPALSPPRASSFQWAVSYLVPPPPFPVPSPPAVPQWSLRRSKN
jgi:hypothetical protein